MHLNAQTLDARCVKFVLARTGVKSLLMNAEIYINN